MKSETPVLPSLRSKATQTVRARTAQHRASLSRQYAIWIIKYSTRSGVIGRSIQRPPGRPRQQLATPPRNRPHGAPSLSSADIPSTPSPQGSYLRQTYRTGTPGVAVEMHPAAVGWRDKGGIPESDPVRLLLLASSDPDLTGTKSNDGRIGR
jgi:hypothetical protein